VEINCRYSAVLLGYYRLRKKEVQLIGKCMNAVLRKSRGFMAGHVPSGERVRVPRLEAREATGFRRNWWQGKLAVLRSTWGDQRLGK